MNPYFRLILLYLLPPMVLLLINLYISNSQSEWLIIKALKYHLFETNVIVVLTIVWLVFVCFQDFTKYLQNEAEKKQQELKEIIKEKNVLLASKAGALIEKYSDLYQYQAKEAIGQVLKKFTLNNEIIHSAQLYKYSKKLFDDYAVVKVDYVNGYVSEDVDINAMIQSYYKLPTEVYKEVNEILEIKKKLDTLLLGNAKSVDGLMTEALIEAQIQQELQNKTLAFIRKYKSSIDNKSLDGLTELDAIMLSLFELVSEILLINPQQSVDMWELEIFDHSRTEVLRGFKRVGILAGILKINEYIFRNEGKSNKRGRIYITRCFEINNQKYIVLLSILPTVVTYPKWQAHITGLTGELISSLLDDSNIVYNKEEEDVEL